MIRTSFMLLEPLGQNQAQEVTVQSLAQKKNAHALCQRLPPPPAGHVAKKRPMTCGRVRPALSVFSYRLFLSLFMRLVSRLPA